jgi:hypothetical protein
MFFSQEEQYQLDKWFAINADEHMCNVLDRCGMCCSDDLYYTIIECLKINLVDQIKKPYRVWSICNNECCEVDFDTLEEAQALLETCSQYSFIRKIYLDKDGDEC